MTVNKAYKTTSSASISGDLKSRPETEKKTAIFTPAILADRKSVKESYRYCLLETLEHVYSKDKAGTIFQRIYPAFEAALQKHLENTFYPDLTVQPLIALVMCDLLHLNVLSEIVHKLANGSLHLDRKVILEKYPSLKAALEQPSTLLKVMFENVLSKAWITKKLKDTSSYQASSCERMVLKSLGFIPSDNKQRLKKELEKAYFSGDLLPCIEDLETDFANRAFCIRVQSAGVPESAVSNLSKLIIYCDKEREILIKKAEEARDALEILTDSPRGQAYIKRHFHNYNLKQIDADLVSYLKNPLIKDRLFKAIFQKFLHSLSPPSEELEVGKEFGGLLLKAEKWFRKYEGMIVREFTQGEDEDKCLGRGICVGLTYLMATLVLDHPDADLREIAIMKIEPSDRFIQSYHHIHLSEFLEKIRGNDSVQENFENLPQEILTKKGQIERVVFTEDDASYFAEALLENLFNLEESNGGIILGCGRHKTFMRFDLLRDQFFFFDPNFCTLKFEKKPGETIYDLAARMAIAYFDLYEWAYPKLKGIEAHQIVRLEN